MREPLSQQSGRTRLRRRVRLLALGLGMTAAATGAAAQDSAEKFYTGRAMRIIVPYAPPSGFDLYARTLAKYIVNYLPGKPTMTVQTVPGAGGLNAVQSILNVAPRDGSTIAIILPPNTTDPILNPDHARFDPTKFDWLGSIASETSTCGIWSGKFKTRADLTKNDFIMGATGPAGGTAIEARVLRAVFGYKFHLVMGYPGIADIRIAAEKGEVDGHCALSLTTLRTEVSNEYKAGKIKLVYQSGLTRHPDLPDTPTAFEMAKNDFDLKTLKLVLAPWTYGRPILAPPNVPPARLALLRKAFAATMKDPDFAAELHHYKVDLTPLTPERVAELVRDLYSTPKDVVERTRKILAEKE
jgi:tripartite-type tricarboxylate transporter receptor subunit TctC